MRTDDWNWLIVGLLCAVIAIQYAGFAELFARVRPRVIYVHTGGKGADPPEGEAA